MTGSGSHRQRGHQFSDISIQTSDLKFMAWGMARQRDGMFRRKTAGSSCKRENGWCKGTGVRSPLKKIPATLS